MESITLNLIITDLSNVHAFFHQLPLQMLQLMLKLTNIIKLIYKNAMKNYLLKVVIISYGLKIIKITSLSKTLIKSFFV
jgi:hypothetical protein